MKRFFQIHVVVCTLVMASSILAQSPSSEAAEGDEKKYFKAGTQAYNSGKFEDAAVAFRQAYAIKPSWKLLFNIGQAEASCKRYGIALDAFERYLAEGGDEVTAQRRKEVDAEIEKLLPLVGTLTVTAPSGTHIWIDSIDMGVTPLPGHLRVTSGVEHTVEFKNGDTVLDKQVVKLTRQESRELKMVETAGAAATPAVVGNATAAPGSATPEKPQLSADERRLHKLKRQKKALAIAGWVTLGVGVVSIASGAVLMATAGSAEEDITGLETETTQMEGVGLLVLGGAMVITGGVLLGISAKKKKQVKALEGQLSVTPVVFRDGGGLTLSGSF